MENSKALGCNDAAYTQSEYIPHNGVTSFSFKENIPHCINAMLALISSGCPITIFDNPFWQDYLHGICPEHKPLFCLKYVRLVHVACNYFSREISYMATEGFLEHGEGFVASTSDFWLAPQTQEPYGATIANFMGKKYHQTNGLCTFMSNKTYAYLKENDLVSKYLQVADPMVDRCGALVDFRHHPGKKKTKSLQAGFHHLMLK